MLEAGDMATRTRKRFIIGGMGIFIAAALLGTLGVAATQGRAQDNPKRTPTPEEADAHTS